MPSQCMNEETGFESPSEFFPEEESKDKLISHRKDNPRCNWMAKVSIASDRKDRQHENVTLGEYYSEMAFGSLYLFEIGFFAEKIREQALEMLKLINMCSGMV